MKKHAALLLAVALAGSMFLASCSGDGSGASAPESSGGTESQSASAEESSGAETPELSGELVVMTLAGEPFVPAWQDQAAVFTEQTGVQVTIDSVPWENLRETCTLELASATGAYDVIYVHPSWFQEFAKNGYLVPADEYTTATATRAPFTACRTGSPPTYWPTAPISSSRKALTRPRPGMTFWQFASS